MLTVTGCLLVPHRVQTQELPHRSHSLDHAVTLRTFGKCRDRLGAIGSKGCSKVEAYERSTVGLCACVTCISSSARCQRDLRLKRPADEASNDSKAKTKNYEQGKSRGT
jgi:hypothetical protein